MCESRIRSLPSASPPFGRKGERRDTSMSRLPCQGRRCSDGATPDSRIRARHSPRFFPSDTSKLSIVRHGVLGSIYESQHMAEKEG